MIASRKVLARISRASRLSPQRVAGTGLPGKVKDSSSSDDAGRQDRPTKTWASALAMGATTLCFVHCTVLPVVLAGLPILSAAIPDSAQEVVHTAMHATSVGFVVPIGLFSVMQQYRIHLKPHITALGIGGLAAVGLAHGPCMLPWIPHLVPHDYHHLVAGLGCLSLLGS